MGISEDLLQVTSPQSQRFATQVPAVDGEQIEDHVVGGMGGGELAGPVAG